MLEPFIWMFRVAEFKEQIKFLFWYVIISALVSIASSCLGFLFGFDNVVGIVLFVIAILASIQVSLFVSGYFWDLTQCVINRENDIVAANVYNNKIKVVDKIELPEIRVPNMIWRGIASIIATILMVEPFIALFIVSIAPTCMYGANPAMTASAPLAITILCVIICPALLWNYARRNSIVAVWNIPKAIYIMGNYPFRYIGKMLLIGVVYIVLSIVFSLLATIFNINAILSSGDIGGIIPFVLYMAITELISLYFVYVYAYIIGTITPPEEA